nr:acetate kinase [bacterium]
MKVLVINCGSSSIKYQLFEMSNESVIAKGLAEKIGLPEGCIDLKITGKEGKIEVNLPLPNHSVALNKIMELMTENGVIMDKSEIKAIGHRLVHAGEYYNGSVPITDDVISKLEECSDLAPLHNPPNILGVKTCLELFPGTFMSGTFDTAFHQTMPDYAYIYPISYEYYEKYKVRRYGFHGSSHLFVSKRAAEMLGKKIEETKIITCHLGNGCSMAAVLGGKSVDTS